MVIDFIQDFVQRRQLVLGRLHVEGAHEAQGFVMMRPGEGQGIGPPLALNRHGDLIVADPVEIPLVMLSDMLNNINGMEIFLKEAFGKCHGAASFAVARGVATHPQC